MKIKSRINGLFLNYKICAIIIFLIFFLFIIFSSYLKYYEKQVVLFKYRLYSFNFIINTVLTNKKSPAVIIEDINASYAELDSQFNTFMKMSQGIYLNRINLGLLRKIDSQYLFYKAKKNQITESFNTIKDYQMKSGEFFKSMNLMIAINEHEFLDDDKELLFKLSVLKDRYIAMDGIFKGLNTNIIIFENDVLPFFRYIRIIFLLLVTLFIVLYFMMVLIRNSFDINIFLSNFKKLFLLINKLSNNDYNVSFNIDTKDEMTDISMNIKYIIQLNDILMDLRNLINRLSEKFNNVKESAGKSNDIIYNQKSYEDKLIVSFNAFKEIITAVSNNSLKTNMIALETKNKTQSSNNKIKEAISSIKVLSETSGKIVGILKMINSITEQTELLSLSAAIEAARAGEAGKGFLIVANEIKKLADSTVISTKEIALYSRKIIHIIKNAAGRIDNSYESLALIESNINGLVDYINEITVLSEDNSIKSEELISEINSVKDYTRNNISMTEKINHQSLMLKSKIDRLLDVISKIKVTRQLALSRKIRLAE